MSEFEQWFEKALKNARDSGDKDLHHALSRYVGHYKYGFEAAISSLHGEAVAEFGGHRHTPKDTTEFFGWMCDSNFRRKSGTKLFTYPPDASAKIAELEAKLAEVEKDAERWRAILHSGAYSPSDFGNPIGFAGRSGQYTKEQLNASADAYIAKYCNAIQESKGGAA